VTAKEGKKSKEEGGKSSGRKEIGLAAGELIPRSTKEGRGCNGGHVRIFVSSGDSVITWTTRIREIKSQD